MKWQFKREQKQNRKRTERAERGTNKEDDFYERILAVLEHSNTYYYLQFIHSTTGLSGS